MKYTHIYRNLADDPGFTTLVQTDSNTTPYVPAAAQTMANGGQRWDGRDIYISDCAECAASGEEEQACAQIVLLRDLDEVVVHGSDIPVLKEV